MIQTIDAPLRNSLRADLTLTSGGVSDMLIGVPIESIRVPDQSGVEGLCRKHGKNDRQGEKHARRAGVNGRKGFELHQRREDRNHKDIDHRPAADILDNFIHHMARPMCRRITRLNADRQIGDCPELGQRDRDRREQDDKGNIYVLEDKEGGRLIKIQHNN